MDKPYKALKEIAEQWREAIPEFGEVLRWVYHLEAENKRLEARNKQIAHQRDACYQGVKDLHSGVKDLHSSAMEKLGK